MSSELLYEVKDSVGYVTFNRPEARNALTFEMYERILEVFGGIQIGDVHAVVIWGAENSAFAAGTDISQFRSFSEPQHALDYEQKMEQVLHQVEVCPVPTIAAITGACCLLYTSPSPRDA